MRAALDPRSLLAVPGLHRLFRRLVVGGNYAYLVDFIRPRRGGRVLDIGCGTADILEALPQVEYEGIDHSESYIRAAHTRFGNRGRFHCKSLRDVAVDQPASYDLVLAIGVLHHLDDEEVLSFLRLARSALGPGGRLFTYDGCFVAGQHPVARYLLKNDRGKHVRTAEAHLELVRQVFPSVDVQIRHDLLRVPYTHILINATVAPLQAAQ